MEGFLGAGNPVENLDGQGGEGRKDTPGEESNVGQRPDHDEWCGFTDGPGDRKDNPSEDSGESNGENLVLEGLPSGSPEGQGSFPERLRNGSQALPGGDDDDGENKESQGQGSREETPSQLQDTGEELKAKHAVDDGGHTS